MQPATSLAAHDAGEAFLDHAAAKYAGDAHIALSSAAALSVDDGEAKALVVDEESLQDAADQAGRAFSGALMQACAKSLDEDLHGGLWRIE